MCIYIFCFFKDLRFGGALHGGDTYYMGRETQEKNLSAGVLKHRETVQSTDKIGT